MITVVLVSFDGENKRIGSPIGISHWLVCELQPAKLTQNSHSEKMSCTLKRSDIS